jgi:hypothetical protein
MNIMKCLAIPVGLLIFATFAHAQLTKTETIQDQTFCNKVDPEQIYSNWAYADQFGSHVFTGSTTVIPAETENIGGKIVTCPGTNETTSFDSDSTDGLYHLHAVGSSGTVTANGYINPKYITMGVTYAPPGGSASSVSYASTSVVGNTTTIMSSMSSMFTESLSISGGSCSKGSPGAIIGFSGGACVTATQSSGWTQSSGSSNTLTISKQATTTLKTVGVPNVYSPVDHDYDVIWLWLNPVVTFNAPLTNTSTSGSLTWTGYGFDYNDPLHIPDVYPILVGYLDGDFGTYNCNGVVGTMDCEDAGVLARSWVTTQTFAPGDGPGITPADYPNILAADPFGQNPAYVLNIAAGSNPLTSTDGRFTLAEANNVTPQTYPYVQAGPDSSTGNNQTYSDQYSNTTTQGRTSTSQTTAGFGLDVKVGGSFFGLGVQYDFKENWKFTWTNSYQSSITNTSTQVGTLSITGPPCPAPVAPCLPQYTEPHEFAVYQDNLYGAFMFWPDPYFSIGPVTPATQTILAGGMASYAIPTAANAGYAGSLTSFQVTGLPAGATASFSPGSGAPGFQSTMTVDTSMSTPAGTYPLTISAGDGSQTYFACTAGCPPNQPYPTLVVSGAPGFSIAIKPVSETLGVGSGTAYTATVTATNGFNGTVTLGLTGLPAGSSATFSPETITGSGTSTLTLNTTSAVQPGTYPLTFSGVSGALNQSAMGTLVVTGASYNITATPEIQALNAGSEVVYSVATTVMNGFDGSIALSVTGLPAGASASFSPVAITGAGSSTLTITTSSSTPAGNYNLTVNGANGTVVQSAPITIEVDN